MESFATGTPKFILVGCFRGHEINRCVIDTESKSLQIKGVKHPIPLQQSRDTPTEGFVWAVLPKVKRKSLYLEGRLLPRQPSILVAAAVVSPGVTMEIPIRLINWEPDTVTIYEGTRIGTLEEINLDVIVSGVKPWREPTEVSVRKQELLQAMVT